MPVTRAPVRNRVIWRLLQLLVKLKMELIDKEKRFQGVHLERKFSISIHQSLSNRFQNSWIQTQRITFGLSLQRFKDWMCCVLLRRICGGVVAVVASGCVNGMRGMNRLFRKFENIMPIHVSSTFALGPAIHWRNDPLAGTFHDQTKEFVDLGLDVAIQNLGNHLVLFVGNPVPTASLLIASTEIVISY